MRSRWYLALALVLQLAAGGCGGEPAPDAALPDAPPARPAAASADPVAAPADALSVDSLQIPYGETEDDLLYGFFVYPSNMVEPLPAVIVIHEWWGLDDSVRDAAARIAAQGYMVLAVDLFRGETASTTAEASALARKLLEEPGFAERNLRSAHAFLTDGAGAPEIATLGFSLGGYWALEATRFMPEQFAAAVVFYGQPDAEEDVVAAITAPVLGLYGGDDRSIPAADVRAFREQAEALDKTVEIVIYPGANHGFANPDDSRYDAAAAALSWQQVAAFLERYLAVG